MEILAEDLVADASRIHGCLGNRTVNELDDALDIYSHEAAVGSSG